MNVKFVKNEESLLLQEKAIIQTELAELRAFVGSKVDADPDEGDADISEREKDVILIGILENSLADIEKALRSIENGQYGICERCSIPIPTERLEAKPDAAFCVPCQKQVEYLRRHQVPKHRPVGLHRRSIKQVEEIQTLHLV